MYANSDVNSRARNLIIAFRKLQQERIKTKSSTSSDFWKSTISSLKEIFGLSDDEFVEVKENKFIERATKVTSEDERREACYSKKVNDENYDVDLLMQAFVGMITTMYNQSDVFKMAVEKDNDKDVKELYENFVDQNKLREKYT